MSIFRIFDPAKCAERNKRCARQFADSLRARGVPLVFATGYGASISCARNSPVIEKPYTLDKLANALGPALLAAENPPSFPGAPPARTGSDRMA